jgi:hypothetical protein
MYKNNYYVILMQSIYKYHYNIMLMSFFIHPSMMNSMDFCCNSFAAMSVIETH